MHFSSFGIMAGCAMLTPAPKRCKHNGPTEAYVQRWKNVSLSLLIQNTISNFSYINVRQLQQLVRLLNIFWDWLVAFKIQFSNRVFEVKVERSYTHLDPRKVPAKAKLRLNITSQVCDLRRVTEQIEKSMESCENSLLTTTQTRRSSSI